MIIACLIYLAIFTAIILGYLVYNNQKINTKLLRLIDDMFDRKNAGLFNDYIWGKEVKKSDDKYFETPPAPIDKTTLKTDEEIPSQIHRR